MTCSHGLMYSWKALYRISCCKNFPENFDSNAFIWVCMMILYVSQVLWMYGQSVPLQPVLPEYSRQERILPEYNRQERVYPGPHSFLPEYTVGRKECTPALFPA